jgi:hypothetical protein
MAKIPFSQTTRALQADHGRHSRLILGLGFIVLALWGHWFFTASTYHYVSSNQRHIEIVQEDQPTWKIGKGENRAAAYYRYTVRAYFSRKDFYQITPGQKARLLLTSSETLPRRALVIKVQRVDPIAHAAEGQLELRKDIAASLGGASVERMEIAVSRQTPAAFLFHTARPASP